MSANQQIKVLASYIMAEIPEEPSRNEGAGDTAVRMLREYRRALQGITNELGVPGTEHLAPVANAYALAKNALLGARRTPTCCHIPCDKDAEWVLTYTPFGFDEYTYSCSEHLGAMMTDAHEHHIYKSGFWEVDKIGREQ